MLPFFYSGNICFIEIWRSLAILSVACKQLDRCDAILSYSICLTVKGYLSDKCKPLYVRANLVNCNSITMIC